MLLQGNAGKDYKDSILIWQDKSGYFNDWNADYYRVY